MLFANLWLFGPMLSMVLSLNPMSNGLVRTTSAVTVIQGGLKENVIPSSVSAIINHRIHPIDTIQSVLSFDQRLINNPAIEIQKMTAFEPHPVSPHDVHSFGFNVIKKTIQQTFQSVVVVPGIMVASTDTKWYLPLTKSIYRFTPVILESNEAKLFHGHDERISVQNYLQMVNYYKHLILSSDQLSPYPADYRAHDEL